MYMSMYVCMYICMVSMGKDSSIPRPDRAVASSFRVN